MNSLIDSLNNWGGRFGDFALPTLWQSSLLIAVVFAFDLLLRRKVRAAVRYSLWFVVCVKLLLPPTLALPTGAAWWLRSRPMAIVAHHARMITVNYSEPAADYVPAVRPAMAPTPSTPNLSRAAWMLLGASAFSAFLGLWVLFRWRQIAECLNRTAQPSAELAEMLLETRRLAGWRNRVSLRVTAEAISPAVCGLFRPVILLPQSLIEKLTPSQLRAVLLHELMHLRRGDVWVNCVQTLLQIIYWWHPLLWIANARMRRVREEAVDDAVMCALSTEAEIYAPTLLEVAKLAFARPLASLGLVGILESRSALRHRIERLLNFTTPRRAGVSVLSVICLAAFTALAVPMGEPPARSTAATDELGGEKLIPYRAKVNSEVFARNIRARAEVTMHTTNDDLNVILVSIMDGFNVNCTGERAIQFNPGTGEVTAQNSPDALRVLDEVVKELNLKGGESVLNPPQGLKEVLIEGQFYLIRPEELAKLQLAAESWHRDGVTTPWWKLSGADSVNIHQELKNMGVKPMCAPRIQTSHGITASLFVGDSTNSIQLECVPYVHDGVLNLTVLARTKGEYAPAGITWPEVDGHTNCAIFGRVDFASGGAAIFRPENAGTGNQQLIVFLTAKVLQKPNGSKSLATSGSNSPPATNTGSAAPQSVTETAQLVRAGELLYQLGKLDEAESKLRTALASDPKNARALYYLNLIQQTRARREHDSEPAPLGRNVPGPGPRPDVIRVSDARAEVPAQNPNAHTNQVFTSPQRQKLYEKLNSIVFDSVAFPNLSLSEVIRTLAEQTHRRDPDQEGINFLLNKTKSPAVKTNQSAAAGSAHATEDIDLAAVTISLDPGLKNVRLLDVLEAIVKSADHPISWSILDYGIEFRLKVAEQPELHTRTFKVDPNTFYMGLQNFIATPAGKNLGTASSQSSDGTSGDHSSAQIQKAVVNFFGAVGVNLAAPKSVFFNARQGTLTVHATDDELEIIEQAVNTLNLRPPEVTVKVRFVEINDDDMFKPGFEWFLEMMAHHGTNGLTGIITEPQFKTLLKNIEQRKGADLLNEGEVTTLSGRQANFQVIEVDTNQTAGSQETNNAFGTTVDVVAYVLADGYTIQLTVIPTITQRVEYPAPGNFVPSPVTNGGVPWTSLGQLPIPHTRVRQMVERCMVWDGQTAALLLEPYVPHKKNVVVFVTTAIIDPSGNRKNAVESLQFAQKAVPPQPGH